MEDTWPGLYPNQGWSFAASAWPPPGPFLLALLAPATVRADHCGAGATVTPSAGPPGTTFVFVTNLGAASDLDVFQNGDLVAEVFLASDGEVRYEMTAEAGSEGRWRMRAEGRGQPECAAEATFTVTGLPGTATAPVVPERPQPGDGSAPMALAAGIVGLVAALRRFRGSADRSAA